MYYMYINSNEMPNHFSLTRKGVFYYVHVTIATVIFSDVKRSCFRMKAHPVFHWCLYNKQQYNMLECEIRYMVLDSSIIILAVLWWDCILSMKFNGLLAHVQVHSKFKKCHCKLTLCLLRGLVTLAYLLLSCFCYMRASSLFSFLNFNRFCLHWLQWHSLLCQYTWLLSVFCQNEIK